MKKKTVALLMVLTLLVGGIVGGTMAWLFDKTDSVTNTFVVGNIGELSLSEDTTATGANYKDGKYLITPGVDIVKNPVVTYTPATEGNGILNVDAYVFVKVEFGANSDWAKNGKTYESDFLTWSMADAWIQLDGQENVYYQVIEEENLTSADVTMPVIRNDTITVSDEITKDDIAGTTGNIVDPDSITFTAYAIQKDAMTDAAEAWQTLLENPPAATP